jgi:hypothetical protein
MTELARIAEGALRPDGIVHERRAAAETAWHFMD